MGLESGTYVSNLVPANPQSTDLESQGDDHLRLIKSVLQNTFPNASHPFYFEEVQEKTANYTILASEQRKLLIGNTTAGAMTFTLPATAGLFTGWFVDITRDSFDANALFVQPTAGTINGFAKIRLSVPLVVHRFIWAGTWLRVGVSAEPAGTPLDFCGATAPAGYVFCSGQTLAGVGGDYPELFTALGGLTLPDLRGRYIVGRDDMNGAAANRITAAGGINGTVLGNTGGGQTASLSIAQLPSHAHNLDLETADASTHPTITVVIGTDAGGSQPQPRASAGTPLPSNQSFALQPHSHHITGVTNGIGSGEPVPLLGPTYVANKIMRLC